MLLRDLKIENYRSFDTYRLDNLARVNLLVGDNNCGKTSVLEAVHILIAQGNIQCAMQDLSLREAIRTASTTPDGKILGHPDSITWFYRNHQKDDEFPKSEFSISQTSPFPRSVVYTIEYDVENRPRQLKSESYQGGTAYRLQTARLNDQGLIRGPIQSPTRPENLTRLHPQYMQSPNHYLVTSHGLKTNRMAKLWNALLPEKREDAVVQCLQVIEASIQQIQFSPVTRSRADVWIDRGNERVTLSELGEGASFLLSIGLAIANARRGVLLLDDIDTGLHYSRLADMWKMVIQSAKDLDVQVFATTHSLDCIRGLAEAVHNNEDFTDDVAIFKIDRRSDQAARYAGNELEIIVEQEIEVR